MLGASAALLVVAVAGMPGAFASGPIAKSDPALTCTAQDSIGTSSFDYAVCGLPDIDQIRDITASTPGLPGNGWNYCAPTATMDGFAYFASQVPALRPGFKDWTDPANYNEMSADILALGNLMGTTAASGTPGNTYFTGVTTWLSERQPGVTGYGDPLVDTFWVTDPDTSTNTPTLRQIAEDGAEGNIVIPFIMFGSSSGHRRPPPGRNSGSRSVATS